MKEPSHKTIKWRGIEIRADPDMPVEMGGMYFMSDDWRETIEHFSGGAFSKGLRSIDEEIRKKFEETLETRTSKLFATPARPVKMVLVLEWKGWHRIERYSELVGFGKEFYSILPNGKRGLFGNCEVYETNEGVPGYLYHCTEEEP